MHVATFYFKYINLNVNSSTLKERIVQFSLIISRPPWEILLSLPEITLFFYMFR